MGLRVSQSYWLHGDRLSNLTNILTALKMNSPLVLRAMSVSALSSQLCLGTRARPTVHFHKRFRREVMTDMLSIISPMLRSYYMYYKDISVEYTYVKYSNKLDCAWKA